MAREVTCKWCKKKSPKDIMTIEVVGITKPVNHYYHEECHKEFLKDKREKSKIKCQFCGKVGYKDEMKVENLDNKKPNKHFHEYCYDDYLKDKRFKEEEAVKLDELKETIENIFGVKVMPQQAYPLLQKLRNGEKVFGRQNIGKRYKEGYDYSLISETFKHCEDTIHYWLSRKANIDGFMGAFKYSLSIVIDKIYFVEKRAKEYEDSHKLIDKHIESLTLDDEMFESNYKKKQSNESIEDYLD